MLYNMQKTTWMGKKTEIFYKNPVLDNTNNEHVAPYSV